MFSTMDYLIGALVCLASGICAWLYWLLHLHMAAIENRVIDVRRELNNRDSDGNQSVDHASD